jgi:hypothetical protein
MRAYHKKPSNKERNCGVAQVVGLEFKPQYCSKPTPEKKKITKTGEQIFGWLPSVKGVQD